MLYQPIPDKQCSKCLIWYEGSIEFFYVEKRWRCLMGQCKVCRRLHTKAYNDANREAKRERDRKYGKEHREQIREPARLRQQKHRALHHDELRERERQDYHRRPEYYRDIIRRSHKNHPETRRKNEHQRRARIAGLPHTFDDTAWAYAVKWFFGCCAYCGQPPSMFDNPCTLHQDHFIPSSLGGAYVPENILPACQSCNLSKKDHEPVAWLNRHFGKHEAREIIIRIQSYFDSLR